MGAMRGAKIVSSELHGLMWKRQPDGHSCKAKAKAADGRSCKAEAGPADGRSKATARPARSKPAIFSNPYARP